MNDDIAIRLPMQRSTGSARTPIRALDADGAAVNVPSLYIHMPFCTHKCHYCDFYSIVDSQDRQAAFADRLVRELAAIAPFAGPLETIFVGGGTPSLLRPELWQRVLFVLIERFDLSKIIDGDGEFSVECNPETVDAPLMSVLAEGGVNRISMGAQSFNRAHLETLERRHDPEKLPIACEHIRSSGIQRLSIDLISAVPGQTIADWDSDLRSALALGTEHLSAYTLTYEPGTAMTARLGRGEFVKTSDDLEADMYEHTTEHLRSVGFERYEVSNYARVGAECRHNMAYWRQDDWLSVGPSASAHVAGWRWKNTPRLDDYLARDDDGFAPICELEEPDARRSLMDRLMTGVRLREGVEMQRSIADAEVLGRARELTDAARVAEDTGWLCESGGRWRLTEPGFLFADRVAADLIAALA